MWNKIKMALGRFVQRVKRIFRKRQSSTPAQNNELVLNITNEDEEILKEELTNTISLLIDKYDLVTDSWKKENSQYLLETIDNKLKFLFNTSRTNLPKPIEYPCASLIVSTYGQQATECSGIDMSQYEGKKLAHVFYCTTQSIENIYDEDEISQEDIEQQCAVTIIPGGKILYYEETDEWDFSL